ncbi:MAG: hypothetical protein QXO55_01655 [Candidatus Korarchaeum sp.]
MKIAFPIREVNPNIKLCKISENLENVKFIAVVEVSDLGLVTDVMLFEVEGDLDLLPELLLELEPDLFISNGVNMKIAEMVIGNGSKIAVTPSNVLWEAVRDLILGKAEVIPRGKVSLRYAN